jgi:hypothetical protein
MTGERPDPRTVGEMSPHTGGERTTGAVDPCRVPVLLPGVGVCGSFFIGGLLWRIAMLGLRALSRWP